MEMYHFVTEWVFRTPIERVWEEVKNLEAYPTWWKSLKKVKIRGAERELRLGSVVDCEVKGVLPFTLKFNIEVTRYEPPSIIEIRSSGGLVGKGKWVLEAQNDKTLSTFNWDVGTANSILNLIARFPLAKVMLKKNHDRVMAEGYNVVKSRLEGI